MLIRIEGFDLPGRVCGPGPDYPEGHENVHVAVQGRKSKQDLYGLVAADVASAAWELECVIASPPPSADLRGPQVQGPPDKRFIYLTWGVVDDRGVFTMFRRAKLWLNAVPAAVMVSTLDRGLLVGRLGLSDDKGWPICAGLRPPRIEWSTIRGAAALVTK